MNYKLQIALCGIFLAALTSGVACSPDGPRFEPPFADKLSSLRPENDRNSSAAAATPELTSATPTASEPLLVIPRPKKLREGQSEPFALTAETRIVVADNAPPGDLKGAVVLQREIKERFGLDLTRITASAAATPTAAILIGGATTNPLIETLQRAKSVPFTPRKPEGYVVSVSPRIVAIAGRDGRGALWGAQTVVQLLASAPGGGAIIRPVTVEDWPTLSVRSVHLFSGRNALPFHKKLIDRIFSRYKMNALFIESERVRWDADPSAAPDWGGTKDDLKQEIEFARERGITVYPLMQSYGHMEWLLQENHPEFAEDPEKPYALCYTDPKAVAYQDGFNTEANALFDAPGFHVGFDEVTMRGQFPRRSRPKTFPQMYVAAATYWHAALAKRNQRMWMWADQALYAADVDPSFGTAPSAADAAAIRAGLPKDIVMVDWQYMPRPYYPSLTRLKKAGFKNLVAATWHYPEGIQNFSKAAAKIKALGMMQTTWCGYESSEAVLSTKERRQFTAMVLAADYFWNGGEGPVPSKLPYSAEAVFARQWADR
ncbi:MAG: beta-N-acetylhexosaminidase [Cytophagales bacterium]|nr:beta-N-acetylhexosaminidase [Armatimonadota bacterium]